MAVSRKRIKLSLNRKASVEKERRRVFVAPAVDIPITNGPPLPYCGLVNMGNTCYINAVVQALRFCPRLDDALVHAVSKPPSLTNDCLITKALAELFSLMNSPKECITTPINPTVLIQAVQDTYTLFEQKCQHDCQEFLQFILLALKNAKTQVQRQDTPKLITHFFTQKDEASLPNTRTKGTEYVSALFEGILQFETKCLNCEETSVRKENFFNLTVPVISCSLTRRCGSISLYCAIDEATRVNNLIAQNKYWCNNCRHLTEGKRNALITHLPPVVIVHVNRFSTSSSLASLSPIQIHKTQGNIAIPTTICFKQWTTGTCKDNDSVYKLLGVILHTGNSCRNGHYTTVINMKKRSDIRASSNWVWFDDVNVSLVPHDYVMELLSPLSAMDCTPYVLFYEKF